MLTGPAALFRYGVAIGAVLVATALSLAFEPVINRIPFAFYFAAVVVGAHVGGLGPGLVATGHGLLAAAYFVFPPKYALWPMGTEEGVALLFLGLVSCTISWAIAGLGKHAPGSKRRKPPSIVKANGSTPPYRASGTQSSRPTSRGPSCS